MASWLIRAGQNGVFAAEWRKNNLVGLTVDFKNQHITKMSYEDIKRSYMLSHPAYSTRKAVIFVTLIYKFAHELTEGSTVVMYEPSKRIYHIGEINGPCRMMAKGPLSYARSVEWKRDAPRDALSHEAKNSLAGTSPLFSIAPSYMKELMDYSRPVD